MRRILTAVSFSLLLGACRQASASKDSAPDAAAPPAVSFSAASPTPTATVDAPLTKKAGDGVSVTYVGGSRGENWTVMAFAVDNGTDEEKPISSALSVQALSLSGLSGEVDAIKSKCDGMAPPHGRFACAVKHTFTSGDSPADLRVRVEGAWFRIHLDETAKSDGGRR